MKIGDKLVATDLGIMDIFDQPTLTIGKVYEIVDKKRIKFQGYDLNGKFYDIDEDVIVIIDNKNDEHYFSDNISSDTHWSKCFKIGSIDERLS